jgi:hypothetical protein
MNTVASMREYINDYVRNTSIEQIGTEILKEQFRIPFTYDLDKVYFINRVPMSESEAKEYVQSFFEGLDVQAVMELYFKISV